MDAWRVPRDFAASEHSSCGKELLLPWNQVTENSVYFGHSNVWEMSGGGIDPGISPLVHSHQFRKQNVSKITLHFKYSILSW